MKVIFIKSGLFALDGYETIDCEKDCTRECTPSHFNQLISSGFAKMYTEDVTKQPSDKDDIKVIKNRGWWTVIMDGVEYKVRGKDEDDAILNAIKERDEA